MFVTPGNSRPGKGAEFNIRGTTSINGGSPLILVDGVQMDINLVNPEDVESISVLKDAASSAIYGARAAYGVILVTTKSGKKNVAPRVSLKATVVFNQPTVLPQPMNIYGVCQLYEYGRKETPAVVMCTVRMSLNVYRLTMTIL